MVVIDTNMGRRSIGIVCCTCTGMGGTAGTHIA